MKGYSSRELKRILQADGWHIVSQRGSHVKFKHPRKPGIVILVHPKANLPIGTALNVFRQAGIRPPR